MNFPSYSNADAIQAARAAKVVGCDYVYAEDSFGTMSPGQALEAMMQLAAQGVRTGFHASDNLGLAYANTLLASDSGADIVDGTLLGIGGGPGSAPLELLVHEYGNKELMPRLFYLVDQYGGEFEENGLLPKCEFVMSALKNRSSAKASELYQKIGNYALLWEQL